MVRVDASSNYLLAIGHPFLVALGVELRVHIEEFYVCSLEVVPRSLTLNMTLYSLVKPIIYYTKKYTQKHKQYKKNIAHKILVFELHGCS